MLLEKKKGVLYGVKSELFGKKLWLYMVIWAGCDKKNIEKFGIFKKNLKNELLKRVEDAKIQLIEVKVVLT